MYDKSNLIKETFITELNKTVLIYGSISYITEKKQEGEIFQIISPRSYLEFFVTKDTTKKKLDFQLTNINGTLPKIRGSKICNFSLTEVGKKRKGTMAEPVESVIIRGRQKFDLGDVLNSVEIEINDDRVINIFKKYSNVYYKLTPTGLLFPSSVTNNTEQIFISCRELNDAKKSLINGKFYNLLEIIELNRVSSWGSIKGKPLWINAAFKDTINHLQLFVFTNVIRCSRLQV